MDHVLENNRTLMATLTCVQKRLDAMRGEERARTRLSDDLGGRSVAIPRKALQRVYGDRWSDILDALKSNPVKAIPVVLTR